VATVIGVLLVLVAIPGWLWQRAEAQETVAKSQKEQPEEQRHRAQVMESRVLAHIAHEQSDKHDYGAALAIALEALPDEKNASGRPWVPEAETALYRAVRNLRERAVLSHTQRLREKRG